MAVVYEIRDWKKHYTVAQNRRGEKPNSDESRPLPWVAMRTRFDGKGYRRVMRMPNSMELIGAWMLIVEVAAQCPKHGRLEDADGPMTAIDLADKTLGDSTVFERALQVFASKEVGWMDAKPVQSRSERGAPTTRDGTVRDVTERNESKGPTSATAAAPLDRGNTDLDRSGSESGFDVSIVTGETLRSLDRLEAWHRHDLTRPDSIVEGSEVFLQNVKAAAAKAITAESVRNEIAVFKWLVKGRNWDYLNASHDEIAKAMKRKPKAPAKPSEDGPVSLADVLKQRTEGAR